MLLARGSSEEGNLFLIGLSRKNLELLQQGKPIRMNAQTHGEGVPDGFTIAIMFGETEQDMEDELARTGKLRDVKVNVDPRLEDVVEQSARKFQFGSTGEFPHGKIRPDDQGEIKIGVACHQGKVILNFGKPIAWIGFDPREARQLAEGLRKASYQKE